MEDKPIVSVIIPTFNRAKFITHAISSVLKQSYQNIEVIVVDDASTDRTSAVVQNIDDLRVKYLYLEQNSGPSTARNSGVNFAQGQFVAFLDSDDEWYSKKIELQLAAITQQAVPNNVVCYTQATMVENEKTYLFPSRGRKEGEPIGDYVMCGGHGAISTSSIMLSHKLALANPFPTDQKIFEDWDMLLRLEEIGVGWVYVEQPLFIWHDDSRDDRLTSSQHDGSEWLEEHKRYLSEKARLGFTMTGIIYPLMRSRQRKLYSLKLLIFVYLGKQIPFTQFMKYSIKITTPLASRKLLKGFLLSRSRR